MYIIKQNAQTDNVIYYFIKLLGGVFFMSKKKQYTKIIQNEIENDNIGNNIGNFNMDKDEDNEDVTKYGEFISSYFVWLTPDRQKKRAKEIDNMTK